MVRVTIDNRPVEVPQGSTILDAARALGIDIPTMCFMDGCAPSTSCMICVVRLGPSGKMVPACATVVEEGMEAYNDCAEVRAARVMALELLLSDHAGDCMGPCQIGCPAKMNIPEMIRRIGAGDTEGAIGVIKDDIALPAVLGRICPAPCEKVCRRSQLDEAVSICFLKRFAADADLASGSPYKPMCAAAKGRRVAIIGAGPAGLSAAYYLSRRGYGCTVFDDGEKPGGALRNVGQDRLPCEVLDGEVEQIMRLGVVFKTKTRIGRDESMEALCNKFDAVFAAIGKSTPETAAELGFKASGKGIAFDAATYQTDRANVFVGGDLIRNRKLAVRSVADGKEAAEAIDQYLSGETLRGPGKAFNTRIGRLETAEVEAFRKCASSESRQQAAETGGGFGQGAAVAEAMRCLHCDCRKGDDCKLRMYSQEYEVRAARYKGPRRLFVQENSHPDVIYESGKCIDCGLCIQIAAAEGERLGVTFVGRGFNVRVAAPFDKSIAEALTAAAHRCAEACPTGALALRRGASDGG